LGNNQQEPSTTFPIAPLQKIAQQRYAHENNGEKPFSTRAFAQMINKPPRTVERWVKKGHIPWYAADAAAIALGLHPIMIWPNQWLALDQGLIDGTDKRAIRCVETALGKIQTTPDAA
jgi:hypothetical protein